MSTQRKVLIVPKELSNSSLKRLRLPHPRTGVLCSYYADIPSETILETVRVNLKGKRSWVGDGWVCSDGSAWMLTPVDPLFIYLWLLTKATQSGKSGDEWRFVDVDNIALESELDAESTAAFLAMKDLKERALKTLCEVRCVSDDVKVARIDPEAVQRWLKRKCGPERLPAALEASITGSDELKEQGKTREMMLLVSEYLSPSWTERLSASFDGFAKVVESERLVAKHAKAVVFDAPESYTQGIADPHSKPAKQPEARPKTAKEKQLEKAARKSKPITSFFQKK